MSDDPNWWCFVTVGAYACTEDKPHPDPYRWRRRT